MSSNSVDLSSVASFVRQHTHDIRNHLNGIDLEAALLAEIVTDPEAVESVTRLRSQIRSLADELKTLSGKFSRPAATLTPIDAREIFLIWQDQAAALGLDSIEWASTLGDEKINVDVAAIDRVLKELLINAKHFTGASGLFATAGVKGAKIEFELRESKREPVDPSAWGERPFGSTKRGAYGLGLWQAAHAIEASGGTVLRTFDPGGLLITKLTFPRA